MIELVLASANADKVAEIAAILGEAGVVLEPRPAHVGEVEEDAPTLDGNARLKAVAVCDATGKPTVADDTGLEVFALNGAPGVRSARYSGEHATYADNVAKLLRELQRVDALDPARRGARFRTVALARFPDGREIVGEGSVDGVIAATASGPNGFGYDPVFVPNEGDGRSFAEMTSAEKHAISHHGHAFRALAAALTRTG